MWRKLYRWSIGCIAVGLGAILTMILVLFLVVDTKKFTAMIIDTVREQTGANLTIGNLEFNPFRGFKAKQVTLTPTLQQKPLFSIQEINITYNPWALLYGTISIDHANIRGGHIELSQTETGWNFEALFNNTSPIRDANARPGAEALQSTETSQKPIGAVLTDLSSAIFVPIRIAVSDVGFENINLSATETKQNRAIHKTQINAATAKINVAAFARTLSLTGAVSVGFIKHQDQSYDNLSVVLHTLIDVDPAQRGFRISKLNIKAMDVLTANISAEILANAGKPNAIDYQLALDTHLDTKLPESLRRLLGTAFSSHGALHTSINITKSTLDFDDFKVDSHEKTINKYLPNALSVNLKGENLHVHAPDHGVSIAAAQLQLNINETKQTDQSIELEIRGEQRIANASILTAKDNDQTKLQLNDINISIGSQISVSRNKKSTASILAKLANITIQKNNAEPIRIPLQISLDAVDHGPDQNTGFNLKANLDQYSSFEFGIQCQSDCANFAVEAHHRTPSFAKILELTRPLLAQLIPPKLQPEVITGEQFLDLAVTGTLPNTQGSKLDLTNMKTKIDLHGGIRNVTVSLPSNQASIQDGSFEIEANGTETSMNLALTTNIPKAAAILKNAKKDGHQAQLDHLQIKQRVHVGNRTRSWPRTLREINVTGETDLILASVAITNLLKKPLTQAHLTAKTKFLAGKFAKLETFSIRLPDFGAALSAHASLQLDDNFQPTGGKAQLNAEIGDIPPEYLVGYTATGKVKTRIDLETTDMKQFLATGALNLERLNLMSTNTGPDGLLIENISGTVPIKIVYDAERAPGSTSQKADDDNNNNNSSSRQNQINSEGVGDDTLASDEQIAALANKYLQKTQTTNIDDTTIAVNADYASFRPFFPNRNPITIANIQTKNLVIENTELDISINQNSIALNNFSTQFIGGKIQGEAMIGFKTRPTSVKAALHFTRLDTEKLVKTIPGLRKKARGLFGTSDPYIDAAAHIQYDLITNDMSGGLNITSIGKDQLRMIMYYLDPTDGDTSISAIKAALNIGEIKLVAIPIKNGEIGVDVDVRLLTAPIPTPKIHGFPIAKLVSNFQNQESQEPPTEVSTDEAH